MLAGGEHRVEVRRVTVSEAYAGQRLDNFLVREMKGVPRSHLYRLLRTGQVRVNGGRRRPDYRLDGGDELRLPPVNLIERPAPAGPLKRGTAVLAEGVLYEDDVLLVVNNEVIQFLAIDQGDSQLFGLDRVDQHTFHCVVTCVSGRSHRHRRSVFSARGAMRATHGRQPFDGHLRRNRLRLIQRLATMPGMGAPSIHFPPAWCTA